MADVFISYHVSDDASDLVRRIADELESMGISCWYAPRDVTPGAFVPSIRKAIDSCNVFLMLWDEGSNRPGYVFHELVYAFNRYKSKEKPIIIPFKIGDFEEFPDLRFYLSPFHIFHGGKSPQTAQTEDLIAKVSRELGVSQPVKPEFANTAQGQTPKRSRRQKPKLASPLEPLENVRTVFALPVMLVIATIVGLFSFIKEKLLSQPLTSQKRMIIGILSAAAVLTAAFSVITTARSPKTWDFHGGVLTIYGTGDMKNYGLIITEPPWEKYDGVITKVVISDEITSIGDCAFYDCRNLTSMNIPDGITYIGKYAFSGCYSLTSVTIPDSVTSIGDSAFSHCESLTSVNIPDSVTSIGYSAFSNCPSLTSVTISDSITEIESFAFSDCYGLTSVTIPDSVTKIYMSAFQGCSGLTSVTIPDSVTEIDYATFEGCSGLTSVTIPNSVTSIGRSAFSGCHSLTNVTIPDSVTSIGNFAFRGCYNLANVTIPDSVIEIGDRAFNGCSSLTSVSVPATAIYSPSAFPEGTAVTRRA